MSEVITGKEFAGYESQEEKAAIKKPAPGARRRKKGVGCEYPVSHRAKGLRRLAVVLVDEAAEHIPPPDRAAPGAPGVGDRRLLAQAPVRACPVVVRDIAG